MNDMVTTEQILQQLKALTAAQQATFRALEDMMVLQQEAHLRTIHTFDMVQRWPFVKQVKGSAK